jgi:hypothetical protein
MEIEKVPSLKRDQYPKRVTICVSDDTYEKLTFLKRELKKDTPSLIRLLLEEFLNEHNELFNGVFLSE